MYICRKCNTPVDDADRFCTGCGAYIGEPAVKKDNWEAANSYERLQSQEEHAELAIENRESEKANNEINTADEYINENSNSRIFAAEQSSAIFSSALENTGSISIIKISTVVIFAVPLLISLITRWSLKIPNDLIDIILPFNLIGIDFKGMLSLPNSMLRSFLYSLFAILMLLPIMFSGLYFSIRLVFKAKVKSKRLWKALMLSFLPYTLMLLFFFAVSFINSIAANLILFIGMIVCLLSLFNAINAAFSLGTDKAVFLTVSASLIAYLFNYAYIYCFMR
jgi:hypothetical protein